MATKKSGPKINEDGDVNIEKCSPQELVQLSKALDSDIQELSASYGQLLKAQQKFGDSKYTVDGIKERAQNEGVMVPLTSSLYVQGKLEENDKFLVEVGAGYFVEMQGDKAKNYCDRKMNLLKESAQKVAEVVAIKKAQQGKVSTEYSKRVEN